MGSLVKFSREATPLERGRPLANRERGSQAKQPMPRSGLRDTEKETEKNPINFKFEFIRNNLSIIHLPIIRPYIAIFFSLKDLSHLAPHSSRSFFLSLFQVILSILFSPLLIIFHMSLTHPNNSCPWNICLKYFMGTLELIVNCIFLRSMSNIHAFLLY